jgi:23S rRNA (cytidine1920-2'-O)/16S rRNA (cytidine1409-2'-O)-methyltransferase
MDAAVRSRALRAEYTSAVPEPATFVSRAGVKLEHALREFGVDVTGFVCADFGANVGGFTDCLLQRGAARVYALETGYGVLAWKLRNDSRVVVMERTNALHAERPAEVGDGVDLAVIDMAWTPQRLAVPSALRWLKREGAILTLIKPHYEAGAEQRGGRPLRQGILTAEEARAVLERVLAELPSHGVSVERWTTSPLTGAKSGLNVEYLALLRPSRHVSPALRP